MEPAERATSTPYSHGEVVLNEVEDGSRLRQQNFSKDAAPPGVCRVLIGGRQDNVTHFVTRYQMDVRRQLTDVNYDVLTDECLPFIRCSRTRQRCGAVTSLTTWMWSLIRSEMFLYSLHVTAIVLGSVNNGPYIFHAARVFCSRYDIVSTLECVIKFHGTDTDTDTNTEFLADFLAVGLPRRAWPVPTSRTRTTILADLSQVVRGLLSDTRAFPREDVRWGCARVHVYVYCT